jgi:hypothetical protein
MTEEFALYLLMAVMAAVAIGCALWLVWELLKVMLPGSDAPDSDRKDSP